MLTSTHIPVPKRQYQILGLLRWTPHPVIVTLRNSKDYNRVLLYSYYTTITGWGVLLRDFQGRDKYRGFYGNYLGLGFRMV